jgi:predicted transcriptional regulator
VSDTPWRRTIANARLGFMDSVNPAPPDGSRRPRRETEAARQRRLAREVDLRDPAGADRRRQLTLEGLADVDAGRLIDDDAMQAWANSLGTDRELPVPQPG